jgi:hypothetical protein
VALLQTEQKCKELGESLDEANKKASEKTGLLQKEVEDIEGTNKLLRDKIRRLVQTEQELRQRLKEAEKKAIEDTEQLRKDLESVCGMYKKLQEEFSQAHVSIPSDQDATVVPIDSPAIDACDAEEDDSQCASSISDDKVKKKKVSLKEELDFSQGKEALDFSEESMDFVSDEEDRSEEDVPRETCSDINNAELQKHKRSLGKDETYANKKLKIEQPEGKSTETGSNTTSGDELSLHKGDSFALGPEDAQRLAKKAFGIEQTKRVFATPRPRFKKA